MKSKIMICGIAALAFASTANAQKVVNITGANAFRAAAVQVILNSYGNGLTGFAHTGSAGTVASAQGTTSMIFRGTFPGSGDTIIRATFTGSVEGIRDLAVPQNQVFLLPSALTGTGGTAWTYTKPDSTTITAYRSLPAPTDSAPAKFAFSDVFKTTSPYNVTNITDTPIGVIVFVPVINKSAVSTTITNITTQQYKALFGTGFQPLSLFTGVATDTTNVYATGRYDLSGTRSTQLAETGYGVSIPVQHWKATVSGGAITELRSWPTVAQGGLASEVGGVWNPDTSGNGGYASGGTIATAMGGTSTAVQLKNSAGAPLGPPVPAYLLSVTSFSDANTAVNTNGAKALAYNGVSLTPGGSFSSTDTDKIANGAYTMWGYEHLLYSGSLSGTDGTQAVFDQITGNIDGAIGAAGIPLGVMAVGRAGDGELVSP